MAQKTSTKKSGLRSTANKSLKKSTRKATKPVVEKNEKSARAGDEEITIDRRRADRRTGDSNTIAEAAPKLERRQKVNRRRQIDPTTCERDYTDHEVEFMNALDDYKRKSGRMFPTCSEVLEVLRGLGYIKASTTEIGPVSTETTTASSAKPMPGDWTANASFQQETTAMPIESDLEAVSELL